jgi:thioredoxin-related protein
MTKALNTAKAEEKWLIVNLQDNSEFACQILNRDLWKEKVVQELVKDNFIFLQVRYVWSC